MTFQEPNPDSLKAMAGWAISKKRDASNEQALALNKFQDGCSELAECCPAPTTIKVSGSVVKTPVAVSVYMPPQVSTTDEIPESLLELKRYGVVEDCNGVRHTFDIRTQRCKSCGVSYREAVGRKSELM